MLRDLLVWCVFVHMCVHVAGHRCAFLTSPPSVELNDVC